MAVTDTEVIDLMSAEWGRAQQTMNNFKNELTDVKITSYDMALNLL